MSILESIGGIIVALLVISAAVFGLNYAFGKNNVATMEQNLVLLRMQTQQFLFGTNYDNLDNEVAIKAGIVPKAFLKGETLKNSWGGDVTLSSDTANGTFTVEIDNIPQDACIQLARFQPDSWENVSVNGAELDTMDVAGIADACGQATNTLAFTAR